MIYFSDQDSTDNFYCEFNVRTFPANNNENANRSEFLYCCFIEKIYKYKINLLNDEYDSNINLGSIKECNEIIFKESELNNIHISNSIEEINLSYAKNCTLNIDRELPDNNSNLIIRDDDSNNNYHLNFNINYHELSELSSCPLCLERLDTSASGITSIKTTSWIVNFERWKNYKSYCLVCSKLEAYHNKIKKAKKKIEKEQMQIKNNKIFNNQNIINLQKSEDKILQREKLEKKNKLNISYNNNKIKCNICETKNTLWICLTCGGIGCDRYNLGHAVEHFQMTFHRYSIDMNHERIWDYKDDKWVHRILKLTDELENNNSTNIDIDNINNSETENLANEINLINLEDDNHGNSYEDNINTKEFLMKIENIICEYNFVLSEQLEQQRLFYENEIQKITEKNEEIIKNKINQLNNVNEQTKGLSDENEKNIKMIREYQKKFNQQNKKLNEIEENKLLTVDMMKNIKEDIKSLTEKNVKIIIYFLFVFN